MLHHHTRGAVIALLFAFTAFNAAPAAAAKKSRSAQRTALPVFCGPAFANMTGAEMLAKLGEQTGGGRLAVLGSTSYVRYPDGSLARIVPCAASR